MKLNLSTLSAALALSTLTTRTLVALKKHWRQMRGAARVLTDAKNSVLVSQPAGNPKRLEVSFSVPKARGRVPDVGGQRKLAFVPLVWYKHNSRSLVMPR